MARTFAANDTTVPPPTHVGGHVIPFRRYGEPFVERIHGAEVIMLPDVGHVPIYDDPEQVVAHILSVTASVDAVREVAK
jgi:pimeloyl-ACP methyl ester carboxylesterase